MYDAGVTRMQDVPATARTAFEQLLREFPNDALAPDAQYQVAGPHRTEGSDSDVRRALGVERLLPCGAERPEAGQHHGGPRV